MMSLVKLHGLGNDFLVLLQDLVPPRDDSGPAGVGAVDSGATPLDGPALARRACERRTGIGADGLVVGRRLGGDGPAMSFTLWNADGSEAEMSGNGMRCLAHAALDSAWVDEDRPFEVVTPAGVRLVTVRRTGPLATWAEVEMGPAKVLTPGDEACNVGTGQVLVDVGNPHLVVFGPDPATVDVAGIGPAIEGRHRGGINVEFATLGPGRDSVTMRVWERGVGETRACGTGSCAAAAAAHHLGRVGRAVTVHQPGGALSVRLSADGTATLAGPSVRVADCSYEARSGGPS